MYCIIVAGGLPPHNYRLRGTQGKYAEAEPLYERSQAILEKVLGPEHPDVAKPLNDRVELLEKQVRCKQCNLVLLY